MEGVEHEKCTIPPIGHKCAYRNQARGAAHTSYIPRNTHMHHEQSCLRVLGSQVPSSSPPMRFEEGVRAVQKQALPPGGATSSSSRHCGTWAASARCGRREGSSPLL